MGYIKGMAAAYALVYCKLKNGDLAALNMAGPVTLDASLDALVWYKDRFEEEGLSTPIHSVDILRHLFVLLTGLGMRESSGKFCAGRDTTAENTSAETAEAGLFQTSFNATVASPLLAGLITKYAGSTKLLDIFKEGVSCRGHDLENFGEGVGLEFQRLSKACPAFAVEFAALALRHLRTHWGPINTHAAEIRLECDNLLKQVQAEVDKGNYSDTANT